MSIVHFTDTNFKKEALESELPVVVDFWASWCGPCKAVTPVLEELAREYAAKIKIGKLDVDANPKTPSNYGIMSIPTLIFLKKGKVMEQLVGAIGKSELKRKIEENI